ncbi:MAG: MbtH family protein [Xanthomonadales bacterium]|nr:MbtH family protein [Xanthomonadales bacterium]
MLAFASVLALNAFAQERISDTDKSRVVINHEEQYRVVINHEEQYSIWAEGQPIPKGWTHTDFVGNRDQALKHIDTVWTKGPENRREHALQLYKDLKAEHGKKR